MTKRKKHTVIPAEWWDHVVKFQGNDVWFLINGRIIVAKDVEFRREDVDRLFPEKGPCWKQ